MTSTVVNEMNQEYFSERVDLPKCQDACISIKRGYFGCAQNRFLYKSGALSLQDKHFHVVFQSGRKYFKQLFVHSHVISDLCIIHEKPAVIMYSTYILYFI